jgi:4-amino-4-deoxy-L-arabinose transferase-like glycosyltransferase
MARLIEQADPPAEPEPGHHAPPVDHFGRALGIVVAGGAVLRLFVVLRWRGMVLGGDGLGYSLQANAMARGRMFVGEFSGRPDALHPPAWVLVLTLVARLGGHAWLPQQVAACGIGTATVAVVGLVGRRIAGDRAGLVAAGLAAVYTGFWIYERALLSETLLLLGVALTLLVAYRFREAPTLPRAVALGGACGLLALTRSEQVLILPLLVFPLVLTVRALSWWRRAGWLWLATVTMAAVIAPWTVYNLGRFQHPVLLSTGLGGAMAASNCNLTYSGPYIGAAQLGCLTYYPTSDESVYDLEWRAAAVSYAEHHLSRLPLVVAAREGRAFGFFNPFQQTDLDGEWMTAQGTVLKPSPASVNDEIWLNRLALLEYWLLLVPAAVGLVALRRRGVPLYPLLAFVATILVAVGLTSGDARYRAGVEVPLVLLAAVGFDAVVRGRARRPASPAGGPPAGPGAGQPGRAPPAGRRPRSMGGRRRD